MQGWAVVDNTVGADWDNVQLSLVAGAPQSFIQPLSQPLYTRRPEIAISTAVETTPQTHEAADSVTVQSEMQNNALAAPTAMASPPPAPRAMAKMAGVTGGLVGMGPARAAVRAAVCTASPMRCRKAT